ncbi:MAG: GDSL-type esterase/lipase family protein [Atopobiaceae bacterium]|nr:GDSL-type esterase/lipase family protein [Atopobiaceae bacterium]MCI1318315.1 GDSL-type esterase/lipase family protein [Atopobiaceae bacterium]MCI1388230.1 GDSL-type esterase/lipase family protein [Atopobiaceae bacterium]MCI1431520.1 GDSL-type esterase/lipase family protein [Atopobiaceae bacterium]MCI1469956.1 GDSL-type esterase/lipase family protein [Atopobiaceae bacterium]
MADKALERPAADFLHGCVRKEGLLGGWVRPWRVTARQLRVLSSITAWHPGEYRQMATCTSGISVELRTDARVVELEVRVDPLPKHSADVLKWADIPLDALVDGFSYDVDDRHVGPVMPGPGEHVLRFELFDPDESGSQATLPGLGSLRTLRIWLPALRGCEVRNLRLQGEAHPVAPRPSLVVLADSLSQGFLTGDPAMSFPSLLGKRLRVDVVNQGIGGQVFQPGWVADLARVVPDPKNVIVELGGNYRYEPCGRDRTEREIRGMMNDVGEAWPEASIWLITPTFHDEGGMWPTHPKSCFWDLYDICRRVLRGRERMHLVDGLDLMDADLSLLADDGHPTEEGARQIASRMANVIEHRRMREEDEPSAEAPGGYVLRPGDATAESRKAKAAALAVLRDAPDSLLGLRDTVASGFGEVVHASEGAVLVRTPDEDWALWAPDLALGRRLIEDVVAGWEPRARLVTLYQPELVDVAKEALGFDASRAYELVAGLDPGTEDDALLAGRDIRPLNEAFAFVVRSTYPFASVMVEGELEALLASGRILGGFEPDGTLAGYIGEHAEGATGLLEVFPEHRGRGWAKALEVAKARQLAGEGRLAWGQVFPENEASLALQRSLGISVRGGGYYVYASEGAASFDEGGAADGQGKRAPAHAAGEKGAASVFGRGHELELEFNDICMGLGGDVASRKAADEWLATTDALYHGGPVSWALTPKIFTRSEAAELARIAETTARIMDKLTARFLADEGFRKLFGLSPEMERLCLTQAGYEQLIPIMRADIFLNEETGAFQFCEINTDGSAGINATVEITKAIQSTETYREFARRHPAIETYDVERTACDAVLACYESWDKAGRDGHPREQPQVLFVDYDESASHGEVDSLCRRFAEAGISARFADIHDLRIEDVDGRERLVDSVGPVDCVWRRAVTSEMLDKPCPGADALIEAGRRDLACLVGSFRTWPVATKTVFAVLWGDSVADVLDADELAFVREHVPETRLLAPDTDLAPYQDKDAWILKPAGGYNSMGVLSGLEATQDEWADALEKTRQGGGVIQRYAPQYATPMVVGGRLPEGAGYTDMAARAADRLEHALDFAPANNMEGLFLFNGRFGGVYTRCGYQATIGEWTNRFHMGCLVVDDEA